MGLKPLDRAITSTDLEDGAVLTADIADDAVSVAKIQNFGQNQIAGRIASGTGNLQGLLASDVRTMINVSDGANQTTINNNADNRIVRGSNTANTLNAHTDVTINSAGHLNMGTPTSHYGITLAQGD